MRLTTSPLQKLLFEGKGRGLEGRTLQGKAALKNKAGKRKDNAKGNAMGKAKRSTIREAKGRAREMGANIPYIYNEVLKYLAHIREIANFVAVLSVDRMKGRSETSNYHNS